MKNKRKIWRKQDTDHGCEQGRDHAFKDDHGRDQRTGEEEKPWEWLRVRSWP